MGAATKPLRRPRRKIPVTRRAVIVMMVAPVLDRAATLDRRADAELAAGRHAQAERLAHRAAELRGQA